MVRDMRSWSQRVAFNPTREDEVWLTKAIRPLPDMTEYLNKDDESFVWDVDPDDNLLTGYRLYTDGSLVDGNPRYPGQMGKLGWAFVTLDGAGTVVAAASGQPPWWVDSIQGAELWALFMAARSVAFGCTFVTDCQ